MIIFSGGNPGLVLCVCELSMRLVALTADDCVCVGVCVSEVAHHAVRLHWAAMSDRHFHQREIIIQQNSRFPTSFLCPHCSLIHYESHDVFLRTAKSTLLLHSY